ncbi:MAG: sensor histidine kinase [Prevotella sp.]|nr:sensor histidine kinase [Prevotella sp.]
MHHIVTHIRKSLSLKLSLGILLMAVPIFVLSLGILYVQSRNNVRKEATERANSVLNTTMLRINRFMNTVETATEANAWEITENLQPDSLLALSRSIVMLNGNIDGCSISTEPNVFPKYGRYFSAYTVRETDTITTVIEEEYEYFEKVWYKTPRLLGKPCWVVYYDESDSLTVTLDGMIASYSKPLYDADERFVGVISTDLSLIHLSRVISEVKPYPDSYFMMTGEDGRYFIHPDSTQLFTHSIFSETDPNEQADIIALGHEMMTGKKGNMRVFIDGKPCLVSYQPVPGTRWSLALVSPERSILQNYNRLTYIIAPLTIIGLLLILFFSSISVKRAIRPIYKLTNKLQRIAQGHYDEQISRSRYQDAVARLQNSFAMMQKSMSRHVNEIHRINEETSRRNEELARISELAKEADRQKSLFIQNVSHQIRTPLNIIMGFAQVLREDISVLSEEEVKSITGMMYHNAVTLDRMTLMLFDSSARGTIEELYTKRDEEVLCNEVALESIAMTHEHFPDLHISFETTLPDTFCIYSSHIYVMRSIREILYNSAKYSDGQNISLRVSEKDSMVRFVFEDTGPGIPESDINRLFEPFTKANDLSDGLGLGLPLAKRHVTSLRGDLTLDTSYHLGCRIIIELPVD